MEQINIIGNHELIKKLSEVANKRIEAMTPANGTLFIGRIADRAGVSTLTLRRFLNGEHQNNKLETLKSIFNALDYYLIIIQKYDFKVLEIEDVKIAE